MWYEILNKWYDFLDWYDEHKTIFWTSLVLLIGLGSTSVYLIGMKEKQVAYGEHLEDFIEKEPIIKEPENESYVIKEVKPPDELTDKVVTEDGSISMLLLGVDSRNSDLVGRSDSMIVVTANKNDNSIKLLSIPRDSYVKIAGKGFHDKITHANAFGGQDMARETVENLLGIKLDYAVTVNFQSFINVIDILGGVEVEVPFNFDEQSTNGDRIYFKKGKQTLNGDEALAYSRMRKQDPKGDLGRGERQQQIIEAVVKKAASFSSITKLKELYGELNKNVKTDIGLIDVMSLAPHIQSVSNIEKLNLTGSGKKINNIYYYQLDETLLNEVRTKIHKHLGEE